jgi:alpha 1,2-mannosyltransferase
MTLRALAISAILFIAFVLVASTLFLLRAGVPSTDVMEVHALGSYTPVLPELPPSKTKVPDPVAWLKENSDNKYAVSKGVWSGVSLNKRPKAALISLVRNSELEGIRQSIMQLEMRWNHKYQVGFLQVYLGIRRERGCLLVDDA